MQILQTYQHRTIAIISRVSSTFVNTIKGNHAFPKLPCNCRLPEWLKHPEFLAKGYSYIYLLLGVYQVITFWYDVAGFLSFAMWRYVLIFCGFLIPPVVLGFILLLAVHKRELQKTWIWWLLEIVQLALFLTLFLVGAHGLTIKTVVVNLILHGALRVLGLKIIYDYMLFLSSIYETGSGINRVDVIKDINNGGTATSTNPFENVPLDDPWSGQEKL